MDKDRFNELIDSISNLSEYQLNVLKNEILMSTKPIREKILSDEERLVLSQLFKEDWT